MKIYWSWKSFPEWGELPENERKMIWKKCFTKTLRYWQTWVAFFGCIFCIALGIVLSHCWHGFISSIIGGTIGGAIGGFILGQVITTIGRPHIRE